MQSDIGIDIFCQNIKMLREKNGLSKKEMAEIMGISTVSLTKIESGILPPRANVGTLFNICKRFNIKPHKLFMPL